MQELLMSLEIKQNVKKKFWVLHNGAKVSLKFYFKNILLLQFRLPQTSSPRNVLKIYGENWKHWYSFQSWWESRHFFWNLKMHKNADAASEMIWPYWAIKNPHNPQIARIPQLKPSWIEKIALQINVSNLQLCCKLILLLE